MKTDELLSLGLTEEQAKAVIAINGKDIEKFKSSNDSLKEENGALKAQISERAADIEKLQAAAGDTEKVKAQLDELQSKYKADTEAFQKQIAERDYAEAIRSTISEKGLRFSSRGAEKAYIEDLKAAGLQLENGKIAGFDGFHERYAKEDPGAFQTPPAVVKGMQGTPPKTQSAAALFAQQASKRFQGVE